MGLQPLRGVGKESLLATGTAYPEGFSVPSTVLVPFVVLTYGLAWGLLTLFVLCTEPLTALFGDLSGRNPLFVLAVYAPAIAAFILVLFYAGFGGLRRYLSRLLLWRCPPAWSVFLIAGIPLLFFAGAALKGSLADYGLPFATFPSLMGALAVTMVIGPVEEFGWRGLALPVLQRGFAPFWAGSILGLIWGLWHLPAFLLNGTPQSTWAFTPFLAASVAASLIVTPLFNVSGGSILLPVLFHFQLNNPLWPDAQPYDTIAFAAAAAVVVWINRKTMFRKENLATDVVPLAGNREDPDVNADHSAPWRRPGDLGERP